MIEKIYIGGYGNTINICEFTNGKLKIINKIEKFENPSYMHIHGNFLYVVYEKKEGCIAGFKTTQNNLKHINTIKTKESLPCYITTNEKMNKLLVANYESGSIELYQIEDNGKIGKRININKYKNANIHFCEFIENEIYAVDLGNDKLYIFNSKLELLNEVKCPNGTGPRHFAKANNLFYIITELSNEILTYEKKDNKLTLIQKISSIKTKDKETYAGAIKITENGQNIYVTNRGEDTISVYENKNKKLKLIQNISCYGEFPRDILLTRNEDYILVANQKSNNITIFKRNIRNGILSKIKSADIKIEKPSCIIRRK